jgi:DNA polymerase III subunit gamma/tau
MSYQVIARKWRPQTFEEVTGQEAITHTLCNALEFDRLHHAYIFSGARGVGKTTTARLLAKALNCHSSDTPTVTPCNNCASCKEVIESRSMDVLEIDAASHTGIDDVRDTIIESINVNPARDRYKVFIIDEVHQLSKAAFNALLKTLEEPPPRVMFIMATTELHKVPITITSRCQEFEFRTIPLQKIYDRLKLIADTEGVKIDEKALREVARAGDGSMRDAQSAFDQVISFSGGSIVAEDVTNALGIASSEILTKIIVAISDQKAEEALNAVEELIHRGQDLRNFCRDLLSLFRDMLVAKASDSETLLDSAILSRENLLKYSSNFSESDLIRFFNSLSDTETKLRNAALPRYILEIGLVKLIEMRKVLPIEQILERLAKLENGTNEPISEKKTLKISEPLKPEPSKAEIQNAKTELKQEEVPFPISSPEPKPVPKLKPIIEEIPRFEIDDNYRSFDDEEIDSDISLAETAIDKPTSSEPQNQVSILQKAKADFMANITVRLPPISSEDLEHAEDAKLDAAFEERLIREGENITIIKNAAKIIADVLAFNTLETANGSGLETTQVKKSEPINFEMPDFSNDEISTEIPILPENPSEEDLWKFANNHPAVNRALKIFRGKIVKVEKIES